MSAHVFPMDESYDGIFAMVRGVATAEEAVVVANVWSGRADAEVRRHGWCRWVPCYCGDGHRVDITYTAGPGRGAFYGYEIGGR